MNAAIAAMKAGAASGSGSNLAQPRAWPAANLLLEVLGHCHFVPNRHRNPDCAKPPKVQCAAAESGSTVSENRRIDSSNGRTASEKV
eukprot:305929-Rhodomonas_salina.1